MQSLVRCLVGGAFLSVAVPSVSALAEPTVRDYDGLCDASAAVALDGDRFVVADDELNVLRIYNRNMREPIGSGVALADFLGTKAGKESDLEGAAKIGKRIYWISSHGRNSDGEVQNRRYRFFATEVVGTGSDTSVIPVEKPVTNLLDALRDASQLKVYNLAAAAGLKPEEPGGLNIEGLASTPDHGLLIGFRNPLINGKALVIPLINPAEVVSSKANKAPTFGPPLELELDGRGIRSLERVGDSYLIVAGPTDDNGSFGLYRWSGNGGDPIEIPGIDFADTHPEALFAIPGTNGVEILSDDGGRQVEEKKCKDQVVAKKSFRGFTVSIPGQ